MAVVRRLPSYCAFCDMQCASPTHSTQPYHHPHHLHPNLPPPTDRKEKKEEGHSICSPPSVPFFEKNKQSKQHAAATHLTSRRPQRGTQPINSHRGRYVEEDVIREILLAFRLGVRNGTAAAVCYLNVRSIYSSRWRSVPCSAFHASEGWMCEQIQRPFVLCVPFAAGTCSLQPAHPSSNHEEGIA